MKSCKVKLLMGLLDYQAILVPFFPMAEYLKW